MVSAQRINTETLDQLADALEEADDPAAAISQVYGQLTGSGSGGRADQIAASRVAVVGGRARRTSAAQNGAATKTWITGGNPRPEHAAMSGETVPLGARFSNGMDGPGDPSGGPDEVAGCNCDLIFSRGAA